MLFSQHQRPLKSQAGHGSTGTSCRSVAADKLLSEETVCAKLSPLRISWEPKFSSFPGTLKGIKINMKWAFRFIKNFQNQRLNVSVGGFFQSAWEIWEHKAPCKGVRLPSSIPLWRGLWAAYPRQVENISLNKKLRVLHLVFPFCSPGLYWSVLKASIGVGINHK